MYWSIIWRRIWIIALVVGVVALYAAYQYYHLHKTPGALKVYQSAVIVQIGIQSSPKATDQNYNDYVSAAEILADEYTTGPIFTTPEFETQVMQQIQADSSQIAQRYGPHPDLGSLSPPAIGNSISATRAHSLVTVTVSWDTQPGAWAIANAVGEVTVAHIGSYIDYVVGAGTAPSLDATAAAGAANAPLQPPVEAKVISQATDLGATPGPSANKPALLVALVLVALVIGIALAFLIDYLDDRIRSREDILQTLQLPVYAEVPRAPTPGQREAQRSSRA
jgi:capsular polysaccharide biosynthesis protein